MEDTVQLIRWAEENGINDGWFSDSGAPDALTQVAAIAHHTRKMRIGVAVTPVYTRTPAVLAATAEAISQVLPGRFIMGLGSSSKPIVEGWNGIHLEKPLTRIKETVTLIQSMLRGEKSRFDLETLSSIGYQQPVCENPPPIYLAGLRPKMLELAAQIGDGVILNLWPQGALPRILEHLEIGAGKVGRSLEDIEVVNRAMVIITDDKKRGRDIFRAFCGPYYATPTYNKFLAWAGYESEAAAIREGWLRKDRAKTNAAMSDKMVDEIAVIGSAGEVQDRIRTDASCGIDTQIIAPLETRLDDTFHTFSVFTPKNFKF